MNHNSNHNIQMSRSNSCIRLLIIIFLIGFTFTVAVFIVPFLAEQAYGIPSPRLGLVQRIEYGISLLWNSDDLTIPYDSASNEQIFAIEYGESVFSVSNRLHDSGLIRKANIFRDYLVWTGFDTNIQAGTYHLSSTMTIIEVARTITNLNLTEVTFYILPGWRKEEIAETLPTSGLEITPEDFFTITSQPGQLPDSITPGESVEGFLFPDAYTLPRSTTAEQLISTMIQNFTLHITPDFQSAFWENNLNVYQAVILASIIQREAMLEEEMPIIASVFFNRRSVGMKFESDPTIQYALGYDLVSDTWWPRINSANKLIDSPFNTYLYLGLPPTPICNPGLPALQAVANPAHTDYYYFMAYCDGTGRHKFSETYEEHYAQYLQSLCP